MKKSPVLIGGLTAGILASGVIYGASVSAVSYQNNITTGFTINESISITISNDNISINNLLPGQYADSNTIDITVTTNAPYGYTLTSTVGNDTYNSRNFIHTTNNEESFSSLDINSTITNLSDFSDDKWGYSVSSDNGTTWSPYSGLTLYTNTPVMLKKKLINSSTDNTVTFKIGAKASNGKTSGTYENRINFIVTGNAKPFYMQDIDSWRDTLTNTGDQLTVVDIRDGKEYWVGKQADGKIWMTQNLDFEITAEPLTSDTTDLTAYNTGGYTSAAGYTQKNGVIEWTPASTAITANSVTPVVSTTTGTVSGLTGWTNNNYAPYSSEGGDVYVYTSASTSADTIYTSLSSCISASHTEAECKHYHRGNYYNWSAAIAHNNTQNVTELGTNYDTAQNSICPAGWRLPIGAKADSFSQTNTEFAYLLKQSNIFTDYPTSITGYVSYVTNGFNNIRSNPLFFVRSGNVYSTSLYDSGTRGYYWSSSVNSSTDAYTLYFNSSGVIPAGISGRYYGFSVRCVARDPIYYMQDVDKWQNKIANSGDSLIATDKRDGKEYWVTRLDDGKIWMTQNLDFNLDNTKTLTSEDTDLTSYDVGGYTEANGYSKNGDIISWTPVNSTINATTLDITDEGADFTGWTNSSYVPYSVDIGERYTDGTWYDSDNDCKDGDGNAIDNYYNCENHVSRTPYESNGKHGAIGNYYNWSAAVAANTTNIAPWKSSTLSNISNNPQNSICPAGWRLPTVSNQSNTLEDSTNEFARLNYLHNSNSTSTDTGLFNSPLYFSRAGDVLSGQVLSAGYDGYYWSSTVYLTNHAYSLNFYSGNVYPALNYYGRYYGFSVRCVAR